MLSIDEAIRHCKEKAKELKVQAYAEKSADCFECAREHEQLAEWLTELKELRGDKDGKS